MIYYPRIYVFNGFPVKGEMGDLTDIEIKEVCEVCHRKELIEHKLSYKFDEWGGEDIIKGSGFHLFSSRIKNRIELELIKGVSFKEVENKPWLDDVINRGDDLRFVSNPTDETVLFVTGKDGKVILDASGNKIKSIFGREVDYLKQNGYRFLPDGTAVKE